MVLSFGTIDRVKQDIERLCDNYDSMVDYIADVERQNACCDNIDDQPEMDD